VPRGGALNAFSTSTAEQKPLLHTRGFNRIAPSQTVAPFRAELLRHRGSSCRCTAANESNRYSYISSLQRLTRLACGGQQFLHRANGDRRQVGLHWKRERAKVESELWRRAEEKLMLCLEPPKSPLLLELSQTIVRS